MQTSSDFSQTALPMPSLPFMANGQKLALTAAHLQAQVFKGMMRYQIQGLAFLKQRCEEDVKFVNDLVASNEFNDAFDIVTTFMQNAATEYATEASKVINISSKLAAETARRVRKEAEQAVEDISVAATA